MPKTHFSTKQSITEGIPTHVFLVVDYGVRVTFAVAVPVRGFYVIGVISCMDGSLKLALKHRTIAGRITFTWNKKKKGSKVSGSKGRKA